jgi:hypothetical protein
MPITENLVRSNRLDESESPLAVGTCDVYRTSRTG